MKPVHLHQMYGVSKRNLGDYAAAVAMLLQAMTGNLSIPGGCEGRRQLVYPASHFRARPQYAPDSGDVINPMRTTTTR